MANNPKYYIIESSALPEVFLKVAEAKRLLDTGEVSTVRTQPAGPESAVAPSINIGIPFSPSRT